MAYEQPHLPIDPPDSVEAIKFRLEQQGRHWKALIRVIRSRTRVHDVLRRDRAPSIATIRRLNKSLHAPPRS